MRPLGVVPQEPVDHRLVELENIISEKREMVLDEVLGERPIEPLDGAVHLGAARVAVVVADAETHTRIVEEMCELASVVGLDLLNRERGDRDELLQKVRCGLGRMARVRSREGELPFDVDGGVDVAFGALREPYDGIDLKTLLVLLRTADLWLCHSRSLVYFSCTSLKRYLSIPREQASFLEVEKATSDIRGRDDESCRTQNGSELPFAKTMMSSPECHDALFKLRAHATGIALPGCR